MDARQGKRTDRDQDHHFVWIVMWYFKSQFVQFFQHLGINLSTFQLLIENARLLVWACLLIGACLHDQLDQSLLRGLLLSASGVLCWRVH